MARRRHGISAIAKGTPAAKKMMQLRAAEKERQQQLAAEIDGWFEKFDFNEDGKLQREELAALLEHLEGRPPTAENLDFLLEKATAIETYSVRIGGDKHGAVTWHQARETVGRYHEYCRDQVLLDSVFRRFDYDGNGTLDLLELPALLRDMSPDDAVVDETDAQYVMEQCDANGDGVISRDEVLPMLARWKAVAAVRVRQQREEAKERGRGESWRAVTAKPGFSLVRVLAAGRSAGGGGAPPQQREVTRTDVAASRWRAARKGATVDEPPPRPGQQQQKGGGASMLGKVVEAAAARHDSTTMVERWSAREEGGFAGGDETGTLQECSSPPSHLSPEASYKDRGGDTGAGAIDEGSVVKSAWDSPRGAARTPSRAPTQKALAADGSSAGAPKGAQRSSACMIL